MERKKGPVVLIIILLVIILGLAGYIAVDKLFLSKKGDETSVMVIDDVNIDLNVLYQVADIMGKFDRAYNDVNSSYFGYLYNTQSNLYADKFDNGAALYAAMYDDMIGTSTAQYLIGGNVKASFEQIFGKNLAYKPADVAAGKTFNIKYNEGNGNFTYTAPELSETYSNEYVIRNVKTDLKEDKVMITRRVFFVEYQKSAGSEDVTQAKVYTNHNKSKLVGTLNLRNNVLSVDEVLAKYGSKFDKFVYTFEKNESTDDYNFYSIEKVR